MKKTELYVDLWRMMLPMIHQALKTDTRLLKLDPNEFTTRGSRQSYTFKLEIIDGLIPVKKGSAVARDLKTVLDASPTFCKFAKGKTIVIRLTKDFSLVFDF